MIWATCETCGKRAYLSRHAARKARKLLPQRKGMAVYACGGYFHLGHHAQAVLEGRKTRREIYGIEEREKSA